MMGESVHIVNCKRWYNFDFQHSRGKTGGSDKPVEVTKLDIS